MPVKPRSNLSPEERKAQKIYQKMKAHAQHIREKETEYLLSFDTNGNFVFENTDEQKSSVGFGSHDFETEVNGHRLVHNHPGGNCFSPEDLAVALRTKEIWAVTKDRIMIFKWNQNVWNRKPGESAGAFEMNANAFINKLKYMYDTSAFYTRAKYDWDDHHKLPDSVSMPWDKYVKAVDERAKGIQKLMKQRQREYFKNNQEIYGFTFTERKW